MADNLSIIYTNYLDNAATLTATSEATGFDVENLQDNSKIMTWRSTDLSEQTLAATWSSAVSIAGLAVVFSNLIANSTIRLKLFTLAADVTPVYDSGVKTISFAYPAPAGFDTINSASFAYGGGNHYSLFFDAQSVEKMQLLVNSSGNPDGFMEISRIVAGKVWTPVYNPAYNLPVSWIDSTSSVRLESGDHVAERNPVYRSMALDFNALQQADKQMLATIIRMNGAAVPVYASAMPAASVAEDESHLQLYGRFSQELTLDLYSYDLYRSRINLVEI